MPLFSSKLTCLLANASVALVLCCFFSCVGPQRRQTATPKPTCFQVNPAAPLHSVQFCDDGSHLIIEGSAHKLTITKEKFHKLLLWEISTLQNRSGLDFPVADIELALAASVFDPQQLNFEARISFPEGASQGGRPLEPGVIESSTLHMQLPLQIENWLTSDPELWVVDGEKQVIVAGLLKLTAQAYLPARRLVESKKILESLGAIGNARGPAFELKVPVFREREILRTLNDQDDLKAYIFHAEVQPRLLPAAHRRVVLKFRLTTAAKVATNNDLVAETPQ